MASTSKPFVLSFWVPFRDPNVSFAKNSNDLVERLTSTHKHFRSSLPSLHFPFFPTSSTSIVSPFVCLTTKTVIPSRGIYANTGRSLLLSKKSGRSPPHNIRAPLFTTFRACFFPTEIAKIRVSKMQGTLEPHPWRSCTNSFPLLSLHLQDPLTPQHNKLAAKEEHSIVQS